MEIQRAANGTSPPARLRKNRRLLLLCALAAFWSIALLAAGAKMHKNGYFAESVTPFLRSGLEWPKNRLKALLAEPEHLAIDIKWEDLQRLAHQRQVALERGSLRVGPDDFVPATIKHGGDEFDVKLRLKGDGVEHLLGDKWSYRVKVKGGNTLFGMKQFSLHHPRTRNWLFEWFAQEAMRREGIVALRYDFLDVSVNGKPRGIYAIEEHFEKRLIEHNERREGPIIRFNEDLMWDEIVQQVRPFLGSDPSGSGQYIASEIDGFQSSRTLTDEALSAQYKTAVSLLHRFRLGELVTGKVFDLKKTATYFALIDLLGGEHGTRWNNIRFYYNPVSSRLEPIAFDMLAGQPVGSLSLAGFGNRVRRGVFVPRLDRLNSSFFQDLELCSLYISELERVSAPAFLEDLLESQRAALDERLSVLYTEFPYYEFSPEVLRRNQAYIRSALAPAKGLHAFLGSVGEGQAVLEVGATQFLPVELLALRVGEKVIELPATVALRPRARDATVSYTQVPVALPSTIADGLLTEGPLAVSYRILGTSIERWAPLTPHAQLPRPMVAEDLLRAAPNIGQFEFLRLDESAGTIWIAGGEHGIDIDMVIPSGFLVECGPGTTLQLTGGAMILSRSPLRWTGTEDAPIVVNSPDGTGQGLFVLQAGGLSSLDQVVFEDLTSADRDGWTLTGAVTFHESPVSLRHVEVLENTCEDGLNLVRSAFELDGCTFVGSFSDSFDADFCTGSISDTTFLRSGNDSIDVSGSDLVIDRVTVRRCGDKAVSAGEASVVTATGLVVEQTRIGLASKDLSNVLVSDLRLVDCEFGLVAFQKKSEFGPGTLSVGALETVNVRRLSLVEEGSSVTIGQNPIRERASDIQQILYGKTGGAPGSGGGH